jgi:hypothetical protein
MRWVSKSITPIGREHFEDAVLADETVAGFVVGRAALVHTSAKTLNFVRTVSHPSGS